MLIFSFLKCRSHGNKDVFNKKEENSGQPSAESPYKLKSKAKAPEKLGSRSSGSDSFTGTVGSQCFSSSWRKSTFQHESV
jgi:hypothetical protein